MSKVFRKTFSKILNALFSEDVFGDIDISNKRTALEELKTLRNELLLLVHPDRHQLSGSIEEANESVRKLDQFYEKAKRKIENSVYGKKYPEAIDVYEKQIIIGDKKYFITRDVGAGDLSFVYGGYQGFVGNLEKQIVLKMAYNDDKKYNELLKNELKVIEFLMKEDAPQHKHLAKIVDSFKTSEGAFCTVWGLLDAYNFKVIRERSKYKNGVKPFHVCWILSRLLSVVGFSHLRGVVHGNIEPAHIMVRPRDHNVFLIDWSYASINPESTGGQFKAYNQQFSAPEVKRRETPRATADMYSVGKTMIYLLGGNVETNEMPISVPKRLQSFLKAFVLPSVLQRYRDAWAAHAELQDLRHQLFGSPRFVEFNL